MIAHKIAAGQSQRPPTQVMVGKVSARDEGSAIMKMLIRMVALGLALVAARQALAQGYPDTLRMTCAASAETVRRAGAVVLHSGPDIYDRYVSAQSFCTREEIMKPQWVRAADTAQCFVGYICQRESWGAGPN
jgi:hypothetical protein